MAFAKKTGLLHRLLRLSENMSLSKEETRRLSQEEVRELYDACAASKEEDMETILRRTIQDDELVGWFFYLYAFLGQKLNDVRRAAYVMMQYGAHHDQPLLDLIGCQGQFLVPSDLQRLIEEASCEDLSKLEEKMSRLEL